MAPSSADMARAFAPRNDRPSAAKAPIKQPHQVVGEDDVDLLRVRVRAAPQRERECARQQQNERDASKALHRAAFRWTSRSERLYQCVSYLSAHRADDPRRLGARGRASKDCFASTMSVRVCFGCCRG